MIRSRMAWAVATNQSRSVAELGSLPTTSASLSRTALLKSVRSSSFCELVDVGAAFERLRPGSAMASDVVLAFLRQRRLCLRRPPPPWIPSIIARHMPDYTYGICLRTGGHTLSLRNSLFSRNSLAGIGGG